MIFPIVNRSQYIWNIFEYKNWSKRFSVHLKVQSKNILFPPVFPASSPPSLTPSPSVPWTGSSTQWALVRTLTFPPDSSWMWLLVTMQSWASPRCYPPETFSLPCPQAVKHPGERWGWVGRVFLNLCSSIAPSAANSLTLPGPITEAPLPRSWVPVGPKLSVFTQRLL